MEVTVSITRYQRGHCLFCGDAEGSAQAGADHTETPTRQPSGCAKRWGWGPAHIPGTFTTLPAGNAKAPGALCQARGQEQTDACICY